MGKKHASQYANFGSLLENSFLAIPIEMAENTLCFQFKLLSLPRPPFLVGYGTDGTRCTNQT